MYIHVCGVSNMIKIVQLSVISVLHSLAYNGKIEMNRFSGFFNCLKSFIANE